MALMRWALLVSGAALLVVLLYTTGLDQLYQDFLRQGWAIVPYLALTGLENVFHTLGTRSCFSRPHRRAIPFWRLYLAYATGSAINLVTPSAEIAGEVARGVIFEKYVPGSEAASAVVIYKFTFSIARMIVAATLTGLTVLLFPLSARDAWIIGLGSALTTLALLLFAFFQARGLFGPVLERLARLTGRKSRAWVRTNVGELDRRLRAYYREDRAALVGAILWDIVAFGVGIAQRTFLMAILLRNEPAFSAVTLLSGAAVWGITQLTDMIFFFVPGGLGVHEGGYKVAFEAVGLPGEKGVVLSLVARVDQIFWIIIGVASYAFELASRRAAPGGRDGAPGPKSEVQSPRSSTLDIGPGTP